MTDDINDALPQPGAPGPTTGSAAETPAEAATAATDVTAPAPTEAPTVEAPAESPAAAASTVEVPTAGVPPVTAVPVAAAPVAAEPAKRSGITVPTWVAALIGAAIVFALGFGIGYGVGDDHDGGNRAVQAGPGFGFNGQMPNGGQMPFGGQFGNGNGNGGNGQMPFGRNGNDNGGNNDGGSDGGSATASVFLGVAAQDSTDPEGAELARVVAGSPAADAGLKAGDVITKFDGQSISDASDLTAAVRSQQAGATVTITYTRDGQSDTTQATLAGSSDFSRQ